MIAQRWPPATRTACCRWPRSCPTPATGGGAGRPARIYPLLVRRRRASATRPSSRPRGRCALIGSRASRSTRRCCATSPARATSGPQPGRQRRQLAAIVTAPDRTAEVQADHRADRGDPRDARPARHAVGRARDAEAIPGARLVEIDGMGHDLPRGAWDGSSTRSSRTPGARSVLAARRRGVASACGPRHPPCRRRGARPPAPALARAAPPPSGGRRSGARPAAQ